MSETTHILSVIKNISSKIDEVVEKPRLSFSVEGLKESFGRLDLEELMKRQYLVMTCPSCGYYDKHKYNKWLYSNRLDTTIINIMCDRCNVCIDLTFNDRVLSKIEAYYARSI